MCVCVCVCVRVQLKGKGTYECSATGLVFEVSEQALVRYSVLSWSKFSEFLEDSWRPAGSIYDVDVVDKDSSVLQFIHFPHSLCLAGKNTLTVVCISTNYILAISHFPTNSNNVMFPFPQNWSMI